MSAIDRFPALAPQSDLTVRRTGSVSVAAFLARIIRALHSVPGSRAAGAGRA